MEPFNYFGGRSSPLYKSFIIEGPGMAEMENGSAAGRKMQGKKAPED